MERKLLDAYINIGVKALTRVLDINVMGWEYMVTTKEDALASESMSFYNKGLDLILINPYIIDIFNKIGLPEDYHMPQLLAKVGHEVRAAYQMKEPMFKETYGDKKGLLMGSEYFNDPYQIDAMAFEECVLKVLTGDINMELDVPSAAVHEQSKEFYDKYKDRIETEIKELTQGMGI